MMDYGRIYRQLIARAKERRLENCYAECHHILPRCMGGTDAKENLVDLTAEEHYLADQILIRMYPNEPKLIYAANMLTVGRMTNKRYGWLKRLMSDVISKNQSGAGNSQHGTIWITDGISERKCSGEIPSGWRRGRIVAPYIRKRLRRCNDCVNHEKRLIASEEANKLYSEFLHSGCKTVSEFVKSGRYDKSIVSLTQKFKKYVKEYSPSTGRGNVKMDQ